MLSVSLAFSVVCCLAMSAATCSGATLNAAKVAVVAPQDTCDLPQRPYHHMAALVGQVARVGGTGPAVDAIREAMKKYPAALLEEQLDAVYLFDELAMGEVRIGGTYSDRRIYLAMSGGGGPYTSSLIQKLFHAELSSLRLRSREGRFDVAAWTSANPPGFEYLVERVVLKVGAERMESQLDAALFERGFLYRYAMTSVEEDFNSVAKYLFADEDGWWGMLADSPRLRRKVDIAMAFYMSFDPRFEWAFLMSEASWKNGLVRVRGKGGVLAGHMPTSF